MDQRVALDEAEKSRRIAKDSNLHDRLQGLVDMSRELKETRREESSGGNKPDWNTILERMRTTHAEQVEMFQTVAEDCQVRKTALQEDLLQLIKSLAYRNRSI